METGSTDDSCPYFVLSADAFLYNDGIDVADAYSYGKIIH